MNGPEHYLEAQKRIQASDWQWQEAGANDPWQLGARREAAIAQVHATLALPAASATAIIMAADATASYDTPGAGRVAADQVAAWKQAIR